VEAAEALLGDAVRSRLKLWREELWALSAPRSDCLRGVLGPLSAADSGLIQIAVQTEVGWQGRALKRLDKLAGVRSGGNPLTMAITELLDIFFGSFVHGTGAPKDAAKKTPSRPSPPPEKAREPGYRVEVRLRIAAASRGSDKGLMHAAISAFRSLDGDNGLRPKRVWLGRAFDRRMLEQTARRHEVPDLPVSWQCAMERYAQYLGQWSGRRGGYHRVSLPRGSSYGPDKHQALDDCFATLEVIRKMAG
jgi:hypothetical protein